MAGDKTTLALRDFNAFQVPRGIWSCREETPHLICDGKFLMALAGLNTGRAASRMLLVERELEIRSLLVSIHSVKIP